MLRFFVLFLVIQATLFGLELTPPVQRWFVVPWTNALAQISTAIVTFFDPNVVAVGKVMRSTTNGFAVSIEAGCNGVEATIVLLAAILAFPAPWKHKLSYIWREPGWSHDGSRATSAMIKERWAAGRPVEEPAE